MRARFHRQPLAKEGRTRRRTAGAARLVQRRNGKGSACRGPERVNLEDTACLSPPGQSPVVRGRGRPERTQFKPTCCVRRALNSDGVMLLMVRGTLRERPVPLEVLEPDAWARDDDGLGDSIPPAAPRAPASVFLPRTNGVPWLR